MTGSDASGLDRLYERLSEDDLYRRFFSSRPPPASFTEKMVERCQSEGFGVVAVLAEGIVAEATFSPLPDGSAEVGITVDPRFRGWLGPYLLDLLVEEARRRGIPNLQAEVLVTNRQMQALLEARGSAVIEHSDCPAVVRLCIGTSGRAPAWPEGREHPRLLVEAPGGRWRAMAAARAAGFHVLACPGLHRKLARCPAMAGTPCPLAAGADVIVDAIRGEEGQALLEAHRSVHPTVPVCVDVGPAPPGEPEVIHSGMDDPEVVGLLQRLSTAGAPVDRATGWPRTTTSRGSPSSRV